ncbi:holo-ACP synthase [Kordiimonas aquimaris]|uniref:holo-ACP synthase n=1 Tax=Kordiimonas aquimaris TaxID=707591 RepID=UPI0021D0A26F|nr:4'-phosphopantetheinyl transferase superfamily protein [Kordiimonas aquimaris]
MNIIGHGVDVVDECRMTKIFETMWALVRTNYYTADEIAAFDTNSNNYRSLSGKIAVKEAVLKSLELGLGNGVSFNQVSISRQRNGGIRILLLDKVKDRAETLGVENFLASVSYCDGKAHASVIAVSG